MQCCAAHLNVTLLLSFSVIGGANATACPIGAASVSGSSLPTACICTPSYYGAAGGTCVTCPSGSVCFGGATATSCGTGAISPPSSFVAANCTCRPAYYGPNGISQ